MLGFLEILLFNSNIQSLIKKQILKACKAEILLAKMMVNLIAKKFFSDVEFSKKE